MVASPLPCSCVQTAMAICAAAGPSRRALSTSAPAQAGRALKKVPRVMLHPKKMSPLRLKAKITEPGAVRVKYRSGTPLSSQRDPNVFLERMSMARLPLFDSAAAERAQPGTAMRFDNSVLDTFKAYGMSIRLQQEAPYTKELTTVVTRDTHAIARRMAAASADGAEKGLRLCLTGHEWSGKSCLLTQAVAYAKASGWIVLYVPDILPIIDGREPYIYDEKVQYYRQNDWSKSMLGKIAAANKRVLPADIAKVLQSAIAAPSDHSKALEQIVDQLLAQTDKPVLVAVDGAQALFRPTRYLDGATLTKLDAFALSAPRLLLDLATGARPIQRGAAIIAQSWEHHDAQSRALDVVLGVRAKEPYENIGNLSYALLAQKLERYEVGKLDRQEAVGLFGLLRDTERLHAAPSDRLFLRSYISSDGIAGHFKDTLTHSLASA